jgi:hypothetical protein
MGKPIKNRKHAMLKGMRAVLKTLNEAGEAGMRRIDLAAALELFPSSVSGSLVSLEKRGLATMQKITHRNRVWRVVPGPKLDMALTEASRRVSLTPTQVLIERMVRAAGADGITASEIAAIRGQAAHGGGQHLHELRKMGRVAELVLSYKNRRWYTPEHYPAPADTPGFSTPVTYQAAPKKPGMLKLDPDAPAIVPDGLKVIECPAGKDQRFTFTPPHKQWRGQITRDWHAGRAQSGSKPREAST